MRTLSMFGALGCVALSGGALLVACTGDDTAVNNSVDGGKDAATDATTASDAAIASDAAMPTDAATDAASDASVDAAVPPYLLVSYAFDNYAKSELSAYSLAARAIAGGLQYESYGTHVNGATSPWVLEQASDLVLKMDPARPWLPTASWKVGLPKQNDAGMDNANPWWVAEVPGAHKAYAFFYNRNTIAVLDTSASPDGGAPAKLVDVSALRQPEDTDGYVELTQAVYVAKHNRVYFVAGNVDLNAVDKNGFFQLCTGSKSVVGAIDVTTDALVDLNGGDGGAGPLATVVPLTGKSPGIGTMAYDAAADRLIVVSAGCNEPAADDAGADAGPGPMRGRLVEEVRLDTNATKVLVDANAAGFPTAFAYGDATHAWLQLGGVTYAWDPTSATLGAAIPTAPDAWTYDGKGHLVGPKGRLTADGGFDGIDVVSLDTADGGAATVIGSSPVSKPDPSGGWEGVTIWPSP